MTFTVNCPSCQQSHRVADEMAGRKAKCACGAIVTVPYPDRESPRPESIPVECPTCGQRHNAQPAMAGTKAKCPCGSILSIPAIVSPSESEPIANQDGGVIRDALPPADFLGGAWRDAGGSRAVSGNLMSYGNCCRCHSRVKESELAPVPLALRVFAFPMLIVAILSRPLRMLRPGALGRDFMGRFCVSCRRRQVICHIVVGVWSAIFLIAILHQWATGQL